MEKCFTGFLFNLLYIISVSGQVDDGFMYSPVFVNNDCDITYHNTNRLLFFSNNNIPFSVENKWGVKNSKDSILVPPIYDSLLALDYGINDFIAIKNEEYFLFNDQALPVFNQGMNFIDYYRDTIYVLDKNRKTLKYLIDFNRFTTNGYPYISLQRNTTNYLIQRPYIEPKVNSDVINIPFYDDFIVEMTLEPIPKTPRSTCNLFYGMGLIANTFEVESARYLGELFLQSGKLDGSSSVILHVLTKDTILNISNATASYFQQDNEPYFLLNSLDSITPYSCVLNMRGDTVFKAAGKYAFHGGCLTQILFRDSIEYVNVYSFPSSKLLEKNVTIHSIYEDYAVFTSPTSHSCLIYGNGKKLYTLANKEFIGLAGFLHTGHDKVINVIYARQNRAGVVIVSDQGTILFQDSTQSTDLSFMSKNNAYVGYFQFNVNDQLIQQIGVYDDHNDCIHFLPEHIEVSEIELIAPAIFCYKHYNYATENLEQSLINLDGIPLTDNHLIGVRSFSIDGHNFIQTWNGEELNVYDENLQEICDECFLMEITGDPGFSPNRKFLYIWNYNDCTGEIFDGEFNRILPGQFTSLYYNSKSDYFIGKKENEELGFIRFFDTEYHQKQLQKMRQKRSFCED